MLPLEMQFHSCHHSNFQVAPTKRKTLLSGLTLCFSMYFMRLLLAYLKNTVKERHIRNNSALKTCNYQVTTETFPNPQ